MNYVLDTNIILFYIKDGETKSFIENTYGPFDETNNAIISIVTIAELKALGRKNEWGERRIKVVERFLEKLIVIEIKYNELLEIYADIEEYSQKHPLIKGVKQSARNMGKNDLWIAATTKLVDAALLTSDRDFEHLDEKFFDVVIIENLD